LDHERAGNPFVPDRTLIDAITLVMAMKTYV